MWYLTVVSSNDPQNKVLESARRALNDAQDRRVRSGLAAAYSMPEPRNLEGVYFTMPSGREAIVLQDYGDRCHVDVIAKHALDGFTTTIDRIYVEIGRDGR